MASLYKRSNGTYYASFYDEHRSPQQNRFSLKTSRKQAARRLLTDLERAYEQGDFDPWASGRKGDPFRYDEPDPLTDMTVGETIGRFTEAKRWEEKSERTIETYQGVWRRFASSVGRDRPLSDLTSSQITDFCHDETVSQATRRKRYRHIRGVLNWAVANDALSPNPMEETTPPSKSDKLPTPVRPEELERVCKAIREIYREKRRGGKCRARQIIWTLPVFRWAFYTGMRATEVGRLRWGHIDTERGLIALHEQKSGKAQTIPLINKAREVLRYVPGPREPDVYVFRTPRSPLRDRNERCFGQSASRYFSRARDHAEINRPLTFHDLRAGFASMLAEAGKSAHVIREAMRHADLTMALKYVRVSRKRLRSEMEDAF
jgi:integrase